MGGSRGFKSISEESVKAKTNHGWAHWFKVLDAFDVRNQGHTKASKFLSKEHGLSPWWSQAVIIRYEWERGLRKAPPPLEVPPEFAELLSRHAKAKMIFEGWPPSHRREVLEYILEAKRPETRLRRIEKSIAMLKAQAAKK